jgi:hypothetical protein
MDTVWTTVKVRRSVLADAATALPGLSNSAVVQAGLERLLGTARLQAQYERPVISKVFQPNEPIKGQLTVEDMVDSCPECAGELQPFCLDDGAGGGPMTVRCEDCGWTREPSDA